MLNHYSIYGITFESEILLPELFPSSFNEPDVKIIYGKVPSRVQNGTRKGLFYELNDNDFILRLETIAAYRVKDGNKIIVSPNPKASEEEIRLFLLGSALGALIHQRGVLPLHASTIVVGNQAISITGASGSGKSSLASFFVRSGYSFLADDITVIKSFKEGGFAAYPGIPHSKLWQDVIEELDLNQDLNRIRPQLNKFYYSLKEAYITRHVPINTVVSLIPSPQKDIEIIELTGILKFKELAKNIYRPHFLEGQLNSINHFKQLTNFAKSIQLFQISRPANLILLKEIANTILAEITNPNE